MRANGLRLRVLGCCAALLAGGAGAQPDGHPRPAPTPDRHYVFRYRHDAGAEPFVGAIPFQMSSLSAPTALNQVVALPGGAGSIRLVRILPRATREQVVEPDHAGQLPPAVQISIDGPTQSKQAWLIADDPERNRLTSLLCNWRYVAVSNKQERDRLFQDFETELMRTPIVSISRSDGSGRCEVPVEKDLERDIAVLGCKVRVKDFLPHFGMDKETKQVVNQSNKRLNPAVLVEIEYQGKREERWVFAKFPDLDMGESDKIPFDVRLDCPLDAANPLPSFVVATVGRERHELWSRSENRHKAAPLKLEEKIAIPATNFTFHLARFVPSGQLVETFAPTDRRDAVTALAMEYTDASGNSSTLWLEAGRRRVVETTHGPIVVELTPKESSRRPHGRPPHETP